MKKRIFAISLLVLIIIVNISPVVYGIGNSITLTINATTDKDGWENYEVDCNHYYVIMQGDKEVIGKTILPHNKKTKIKLPKIKGDYTLSVLNETNWGTREDASYSSNVDKTFSGKKSISLNYECNDCGASHGYGTQFKLFGSKDGEVNSDASEIAGAVGMMVAAGIVLGAGAVAVNGVASVAGVAAASAVYSGGADSDVDDSKSRENTFKMVLFKDFGNKIKYNDDPVFIYAHMVEITPEGDEIDRLDLTQNIEIFSRNNFLQVGETVLSGSEMAASVEAIAEESKGMPSEGIISLKFNGEGGTFQNNVTFQMVGEPYIELPKENIYVLAKSKNRFEMPFELVDFMDKVDVKVTALQDDRPFTIELGKDDDGNDVIVAIDQDDKEEFDKFFDAFSCEISAENEKEYAKTIFNVVMCYEGLLAEFVGGKKEVKGYKDRKTDLMAETLVDFKLGLYDKEQEALVFQTPEDLAFTYSDEAGICEIIGLEAEIDEEWHEKNAIRYKMRAKKPFPSDTDYNGDFSAMCKYNDEFYEYNAPVILKPDVQIYNEMVEVEEAYQNCIHMIKSYLPTEKGEKLIATLNDKRQRFKYGARDYQIYRQFVWNRAQYYIMTEHRDYMRESAFYDDMICICEWTQFVGDIAFEMALMPFGGPLASFVLGNGKNLLISVVDIYITKGTIEMDDIAQYLIGVLGGLDGVVSTTPSPSEYKKLALWLIAFFCYKVIYHRIYSLNANGKRVDSWYDAIVMGFKDLAIKGLLASFGSNLMGDADDTLNINTKNTKFTYNKYQDDELMKPLTDIGDSAVEAVNSKLDMWLSKLYKFLDDIVDGVVTI